jgi:iron-sulfur cluster repair protein YtfE (RIC family)
MPESACDHLRRDHRAIEERLDTLLSALLHLTPDLLPGIRDTFGQLRALAAIHFQKEEEIFYPKLRPLASDLLARLDGQHEEVRELEGHLAELLADPPPAPDARWLNELRSLGIEFHDRIQHHIVDEEDQLFRLAGDCVGSLEQERLAKAMERIQRGAAEDLLGW